MFVLETLLIIQRQKQHCRRILKPYGKKINNKKKTIMMVMIIKEKKKNAIFLLAKHISQLKRSDNPRMQK
jgi:hypothetical protein